MKPTVRPLTPEERSSQVTYQLMDKAKVTAMKRQRMWIEHLWFDLNLPHATAIHEARKRSELIKPGRIHYINLTETA